jgi:hypothetical protein
MAKRREKMEPNERTAELLRKLTIVQLGLAGVGQLQIRQIVGGGMGEINSIVKLLRSKKRGRQVDGPSKNI